jgi:hypothetical protein
LPGQLGTAVGLFETARFGGAALAAGLVGSVVANHTTTDGFRRLWMAIGLLSFALLAWAARPAAALSDEQPGARPVKEPSAKWSSSAKATK